MNRNSEVEKDINIPCHATRAGETPGLVAWQFLFLAWVLGVFASDDPSVACIAFLLFVFLKRLFSRNTCSYILLVLCFIGGGGVGVLSLPSTPETFPSWVGSKHSVRVQCTVTDIERKPEKRFDVICDNVHRVDVDTDDSPALQGKLVVTMRAPDQLPMPGDAITFTDRIERVRGLKNPGGFDYELYRQRQGIFTRAYVKQGQGDIDIVRYSKGEAAFRQRIELLFLAGHSEPIAQGNAILLALFTGDRSALSEYTVDVFRRASLAHTLALSGMHVSIVAILGFVASYILGFVWPKAFLYIPRRKLGVIFAFPIVGCYIWLGGFTPSLLRAGLMFACFGLLLLFNRRNVLIDALFAALAAIVIVHPQAVFDIRLQLSGLAVAGIAWLWTFGRRVGRFLFGPIARHEQSILRRIAYGMYSLLWVSISAQLAVMPLTARVFGEISPYILLNLIWPPILSFLVYPLGLASLLSAFVFHAKSFASLLVSIAASCCQYVVEGLVWLDAQQWLPAIAVWRPIWITLFGYGILLIVAVVFTGETSPIIRTRCRHVALAGLMMSIAPVLFMTLGVYDDRVTVSLLDTGQSQSVVISYGKSQRILVDAGGGFGSFDSGRFVVGPYLSDGRPPHIDRAFLSHPEYDHFGGYPYLFNAFNLHDLYTNGRLAQSKSGERFLQRAHHMGTLFHTMQAGDVMELGYGLQLEVLHPSSAFFGSANDESLVLRLVKNGTGLVLIPGDVENIALDGMRTSSFDYTAQVLVLAHHGSKTSLNPQWYRRVHPSFCLASAAQWRAGVLPSPEVLQAVQAQLCQTYVTALDGAITVHFDEVGKVNSVETSR